MSKFKSKLLGSIFLSLFLLQSFSPVYAASDYSLSNENNLKYEVLFKDDEKNVNFFITSQEKLDKDLIKSEVIINDGETTEKIKIDSNDLIETEKGLKVSVKADELPSEKDLFITLNTDYHGDKQSITKKVLIKPNEKTFLITDYTNNKINLFNKVSVDFKWELSGLTNEQIKNLDISVTLDDMDLSVRKDGRFIYASVSSLYFNGLEENSYSLKFYIHNSKNEFVNKKTVSFYYTPELLSFRLNKRYLELSMGMSTALIEVKNPAGFQCDVKYSSSDPDIVSVDEDGVITGKKVGTSVITASCDGKISKSFIKVHNYPLAVSFSTNKKFVEVGKQKLIDLVVTPETAELDYESLYLRSSDFIIANIDKKTGMITAYNEGDVTFTYWFNHQEVSEVYEIIPAVKSIETDLEEWFRMQVGDQKFFTTKTLPFDITEYTKINVYPEDENILKIEGNTITAIGTGTTHIIFEYDDVKTMVEVEVIESDENLSDFALNNPQTTLDVGETFDLREVFISRGIDFDTLTFWVTKNKVLSVTQDGIVTAISPGEVLIKITSDTTTQYFKITVN